jgi:hypothetical protein
MVRPRRHWEKKLGTDGWSLASDEVERTVCAPKRSNTMLGAFKRKSFNGQTPRPLTPLRPVPIR